MALLIALAGVLSAVSAVNAQGCSASSRGAVLVQVHSSLSVSQADVARSNADASVARWGNPLGTVFALQKGFEAIKSAVKLFKAEPPDFVGGTSLLGTGLLDSIDAIITEEEKKKNWQDYDEFRQAWRKAFEDLPGSVDNITQDLKRFAEQGEVASLVSAVSQILSKSSDLLITAEIDAGLLGKEISDYLETLNKAFASLGEALDDFDNGNSFGGIEAIYYGLRNASQMLLPASVQNATTYSTIVASLDEIVSGISKDILTYKRQLAETGVCLKVSKPRDRYNPSVCPNGYVWDGQRHCQPEAQALCWNPPERCVPEFSYKGEKYVNCTSKDHNQGWCSHDAEYNGRWSNCPKKNCAIGASKSETTITTTSASRISLKTFEPVDRGDDRACRGGTAQDNDPSNYKVFSNKPSLEDCKTECRNDPLCKGIEHNAKAGRCEVWVRPVGIESSIKVAGFKCLSYDAIQNSASLLSAELDWGFFPQKTEGSVPATCNTSESSELPENNGGWCYADCPKGFEAHGANCWTSCGGSFPADGSLMCGKDQSVLSSTVKEILTTTLHSVINLATTGVSPSDLKSTIDLFTAIGKPFMLSQCPEQDV